MTGARIFLCSSGVTRALGGLLASWAALTPPKARASTEAAKRLADDAFIANASSRNRVPFEPGPGPPARRGPFRPAASESAPFAPQRRQEPRPGFVDSFSFNEFIAAIIKFESDGAA